MGLRLKGAFLNEFRLLLTKELHFGDRRPKPYVLVSPSALATAKVGVSVCGFALISRAKCYGDLKAENGQSTSVLCEPILARNRQEIVGDLNEFSPC